MPLQKQPIEIGFSLGLDLKTDPKQVQLGKFLSLENSVFDDLTLKKRNGYGKLTSLPDTSSTFVTTFNGNLTAIGVNLEAYSQGSKTWINKGKIQPLSLSTLPLIRSNANQIQSDTAVAPNGLACVVYTDVIQNPVTYRYAVVDSVTGQNIVAPTVIPVTSGAVAGSPRVFLLGNYFVIVFTNLISTTNHLQYIAININTLATTVAADLSALYTPAAAVAFDGVVANNNLYLAWNGSDGGGAIRMTYLDATLTQHNTVVFTGKIATIMSVTADLTGSTAVIYAAFYNSGSSTGFILAVNQQLSTVLAPTSIISSGTVSNITAAAQNGVATVFYEVANNYSYDNAIASNFIDSITCMQSGTVGSATVVLRSVGLGSKAFIISGVIYFLAAYASPYQPTYFLSDASGSLIAKLAYSNGGGYVLYGLPSVAVTGNLAQFAYLFKDQIQAVNKSQNATSVGGIYSQTGINLASVLIKATSIVTTEIGNDLHLSGGFLWMYDGYTPVEHNFHLWPDSVELSAATTGGHLAAQQYFYQVTYEWTDNQGNAFRSAPSIPVSVTTTGSTSAVTVNVPALRLTYKTANPVKIVIYRWSAAQQTYFQVTSITSPTLNPNIKTTDSVAFVDTLADSSIIGNNIIYTNGGVVEDIAAPATNAMTLFDDRVWLIDAEDQNLLWFSKQVIESTPVEMSDLFTMYVAPSSAAQGSTGVMKSIAPLDDKLIIFKKNAVYYVNGTGPDNTGQFNEYSQPIFVTSTVGCANQASIVFIPQGLMFQSDKGIWLLGRDLSTSYIGKDVEAYNSANVLSAVNVPGTTQVRFTLDNGVTLMYDYFFGQWGTFTNVPAISSTLYGGLHTFINSFGQVFQETPGSYLDGSNPVLMSFKTSWIKLAGLQGYQRAYFFTLLGTYISPHKLNLSIGYDYAAAPSQSLMINPTNYVAPWGGGGTTGPGSNPAFGNTTPWGGPGSLYPWQINLRRQLCQAFQITCNEIFDPFFGTAAGAGLTLSGINCVVGVKKGYAPIKTANTVG